MDKEDDKEFRKLTFKAANEFARFGNLHADYAEKKQFHEEMEKYNKATAAGEHHLIIYDEYPRVKVYTDEEIDRMFDKEKKIKFKSPKGVYYE